MFTSIYHNGFPTSPLSVAKETTAVEKCVQQPWDLREAPHISTVISLLIHLIVDVKKCVRHFFVLTHPLYMRPLMTVISAQHVLLTSQFNWTLTDHHIEQLQSLHQNNPDVLHSKHQICSEECLMRTLDLNNVPG